MTATAPEAAHDEPGPTRDGLRERKRAAARKAVERTALRLALDRGYENVTVEAICDASMVSPRTFFNYFGSKEGVFVGTDSPLPPAEARERYVARGAEADHGTALGDLVETLASGLLESDLDPDFFRSRRRLIQSVPELEAAFIARMTDVEGELNALALDRLLAQGRSREETPDLRDEAEMIVSLALGVIHFALRRWKSSPEGTDPGGPVRRSIHLAQRITDKQ